MATNYDYIGICPDGLKIGDISTEKLAVLGATPVARQTAGTDAPAIAAGDTASAVVASIHSIALAAASLANINSAILKSFGFCA